MNLYLSGPSFEVGGQRYEGFPILIDNAGAVVEVALLYFVEELLGRAGARDLKTWGTYGQHLYDYFGYLEAKNLRWDDIPELMSGDVSPLAHYIQWCDATVGNDPGYINDKVGTVQRFYRWAQRGGLIDVLPFAEVATVSSHDGGPLAYASGKGGKQGTTDMRLPEAEPPIVVLSRNQIDVALRSTSNPTHYSMLMLGLNAGLRAEELTSFPAQYVVDCRKLSDKVKTVPVYLSPRDMNLKNDKPRIVRVSVTCMNHLWQYRAAVRPALANARTSSTSELFR